MWEKIMESALANGIWAVLFLIMLIYQLKDSRKREDKYQKVIFQLSENIGALDILNKNIIDVKSGVDDMKKDISAVKSDIKEIKTDTVKNKSLKIKKAG